MSVQTTEHCQEKKSLSCSFQLQHRCWQYGWEVRTPNGILPQSWAQNMVCLQPCSLGLQIIFPQPSQLENCPEVFCPLTSPPSPCAWLPAARGFKPHCCSFKSPVLPVIREFTTPCKPAAYPHYWWLVCSPIFHQRVLTQWLQTSSGLAKEWTSLLFNGLNYFSKNVWIPSKFVLL